MSFFKGMRRAVVLSAIVSVVLPRVRDSSGILLPCPKAGKRYSG